VEILSREASSCASLSREPLLRVEDLKVRFHTERGMVAAVNDISYDIYEGEIVGLVGESGSGKTVSQLAVMQLVRTPPGEIAGGRAVFEGQELLRYPANGREMRSVRGRKIAMIFQEPMTSLNPALTIGLQLREMLELHLGMSRSAARERSIELLRMVGIPDAAKRIDDYPHQFSGGMRQRVMVAMAISCSPKIVIADEATTALDATTQLQLLELMRDMVSRLGASLVLVTHNLGVVARYAQRVYVMYAGRIVEHGTVAQVLSHPQHPYTRALIQCVPRPGLGNEPLTSIEGMPSDLIDLQPTCTFLPRCPHKQGLCEQEVFPELELVGPGHYVACYRAAEEV
jgi:peptide/nickel transport system ATP-binding protein